MSNKSYPIKENSNVMKVQGGEQKVMKKILTVALSTAMAFSMFASVAFGDSATAVTPQEKFDALAAKGIFNGYPDKQAHLEKDMTRAEFAKVITKLLGLKEVTGTLSYKDAGYDAKNWAVPYIEAVTAAGIMEGQDTVKKIFNYNGKVTVQEMAAVLVRALKLEVPADASNSASDWAKGYVQAVIDKGLISKDLNFQANASRSQLVEAAYAIDQLQNVSVKSYEVSDAGKTVTFTLNTGEVVKVTLDKALEANKETEVKYTAKDGVERVAKVTYVVTDATKVDKVSASNLREVVVAFDGEVDPTTAEDESNYSINKNINVKGASLSADKKTVTLTVESTTNSEKGLVNQTEYQLNVTNVRSGGKVINASDVKFTPVDAALPTADSAEALGNKAIKVTFSEPVVPSSVTANNFKLDGASVVGTIDVSGRVVVVKMYSAIATGEHTVTVAGVKDYSGLANVSSDLKVNVIEDKVAPTVSVEKATFEEVTLKFSEPVDKATVIAGNIYWLDSTTKRYASSVEAISDDTYKVKFSANPLKYATSLYVSNVSDYSGNVIAAGTTVAVNPVVDQTRPEVVSVKFVDGSSSDFDVKFTKDLKKDTAEAPANYVIKKADGTVVSQFKTAQQTDNKTVRVHLYNALSAGTEYTLEVSNVADATTLHNVMLPYSTNITLGDVTPPELKGASKSSTAQRLVVTYNEAMATSGTGSILEKTNYIYYKGGTYTPGTKTYSGGQWTSLPGDASIIASSDSKSAIIIFPTDFNLDTVTGIRVTSVKDLAGNTLKGLVAETNVAPYSDVTATSAKATASNKIEVVFSENIQSATASDFVVRAGGSPVSVIGAAIDGDTVTLTLADDMAANATIGGNAVDVTVVANGNIVTPAGAKVTAAVNKTVADGISPSIKSISKVVNGKATVTFNENVTIPANGKYDFEVLANGNTLTLDTDYKVVNISANSVDIELQTVALTKYKGKVLDVRIRPYPQFITDTATPDANVVAGGSSFFSAYIPSDYTAPTVSSVDASTSTSLVLTLSEPATVSFDNSSVFKKATVDANDANKVTISSTTAAVTGNQIKFTLTDSDGNNTSYIFEYDGTDWNEVN
ncbi:Ig-like domain-containing protein [Paenibacillus chibensis]|uniref:Ig-like domain-containing protein n=1 Tax=Paenibacillus chibensis TaxID=59846 RepID=A0ABU6PRM3_9BACL|nr:Ig-like domain-containing protein [Paenibacillus chibensis]